MKKAYEKKIESYFLKRLDQCLYMHQFNTLESEKI